MIALSWHGVSGGTDGEGYITHKRIHQLFDVAEGTGMRKQNQLVLSSFSCVCFVHKLEVFFMLYLYIYVGIKGICLHLEPYEG